MDTITEVNNEANTLITQTSTIIKNIYNRDNAAQLAHLSMMIPKLDEVILRYKPFFPDSIQIYGDEQFMNIANQRIKSFLRSRRETILSMYERTFGHYHHLLDELTSQIVRTSLSLKTIQENSTSEIDQRLEDMKKRFELEYEEMRETNKNELNKLEKKIDQNINGIDSRVGEEDQRLTLHYEKLLQSKKESLKMTEAAFEKAKNEADETTASAQAEISSIVSKNNEILKEHNKSVMSTLDDEEKKVTELQEKVDTITEEFNKVIPEFDKKWQERENELLSKFKEEDDQFQLKMKETEEMLTSTQKQIDEYNEQISNIQSESVNSIENSKNEMEEKLQNIINLRKSQIDQEVNSRKEKYESRIRELEESLKKLAEQLEIDENALKERIQEKNESHQDRIKKIEDGQRQFVSSIEKEMKETMDAIEQTKADWQDEREKIENDSKSEFFELQQKSDKSKKYFELKFEALRKELHHVLQENAKIFNRLSADNDDLVSMKLKHKEEEAQLASDLQSKMRQESNLKIQLKIDELKKKHSEERERIIAEINTARQSESDLASLYNDALDESQKQPDRLFTSFTQKEKVEEISQSESEKWRKEVFDGIKALKDEEADALKQLCETKDEFKTAVCKALNLREKLTKASNFYSNEVEKIKGENEEQLKELQEMIVAKQAEVSELERQYEENEKELNRKARLVEKAEDRLNGLRIKLLKEKEIIREKIKNDFAPLISKENEKSNEMARTISEITSQLREEIEMKKKELALIEASNAAMIDGVRNETEEIVNEYRSELEEQLKDSEALYVDELFKEEELRIQEINQKVASFQNDQIKLNDDLQIKLEDQKNRHKDEIDKLNREIFKLEAMNSDKRSKLESIKNSECRECSVLKKSIKKIEKQIISMQEEERDLALTDKNHNETYKTFHNSLRNTLPPLRKY